MSGFKLPKLSEIRKAIINATGLAASLVSLGFLHGAALIDVNTAIAIATVVVHYIVPNGPTLPHTVINQTIVAANPPAPTTPGDTHV